MKPSTFLIAGSLAANVALLAWSRPGWLGDVDRIESGTVVASVVAQPGLAPAPLPDPTDIPVAMFDDPDPARLRDALRNAGAEPEWVAAILEGTLRRRHEDEWSRQRIERARNSWWRLGGAGSDEARLLKERVHDPLRALTGRDPRDLADAENRYPFLPPEKRRRLAEIDLDYAEMEAATSPRSLDRLDAERKQAALLATELRRDVLATLSPEERAEYEMRFGGAAAMVSLRVATYDGTEAEYRAIKPLLDEFNQRSRALPSGPDFAGAYGSLQQETMDRLVAAVGYDMALNYVWSGPGLYPELVHSLQKLGYPVNTAAQLLQLAALTGDRAAAIHRDASLAPAERRRALETLQGAVRPELDAIVPEGHRQQLPERGIAWFGLLAEGRYRQFWPTLLSSGLGEVAPLAVETNPVSRSVRVSPLPRRPAGP